MWPFVPYQKERDVAQMVPLGIDPRGVKICLLEISFDLTGKPYLFAALQRHILF